MLFQESLKFDSALTLVLTLGIGCDALNLIRLDITLGNLIFSETSLPTLLPFHRRVKVELASRACARDFVFSIVQGTSVTGDR